MGQKACEAGSKTLWTAGYYSGSLGMLVDDIAALRPTLFVGVPRVWERVHAGVMEQLKNSRKRASTAC